MCCGHMLVARQRCYSQDLRASRRTRRHAAQDFQFVVSLRETRLDLSRREARRGPTSQRDFGI
jgi:hypothetical protein